MTSELMLRRKWTLRAHGEQVVFVKKRNERAEHVLMKSFLWALYLPDYPDLTVEISIGDRYKPAVSLPSTSVVRSVEIVSLARCATLGIW